MSEPLGAQSPLGNFDDSLMPEWVAAAELDIDEAIDSADDVSKDIAGYDDYSSSYPSRGFTVSESVIQSKAAAPTDSWQTDPGQTDPGQEDTGHTPDEWSSLEDLMANSWAPGAAPEQPSDFSDAAELWEDEGAIAPLDFLAHEPDTASPELGQEALPLVPQTEMAATQTDLPRVRTSAVQPVSLAPLQLHPDPDAPIQAKGSHDFASRTQSYSVSGGELRYAENKVMPILTMTMEEKLEEKQKQLKGLHDLEPLAREIYCLLRQRLEIERERHQTAYHGNLPW